jgi:hypothetical protein
MPFLIRTVRPVVRVSLAGALALCVLLGVVLAGHAVCAQDAVPGPNSDSTYKALRNLTLSGESVAVRNLVLKRDTGIFHLRFGTVCFVAPVNGKVTGAVFTGDGSFTLDPPIEVERRSLNLLTRETEFSERFLHLVLRFTDSTYDDFKRLGSPGTGTCDVGPLKDSQNATRHRLRYNLEARILQDLLGNEAGLFVAFIHGQHYNERMLYAVDPHGVPEFAEELIRDTPVALPLSPEEVVLMTYDDNNHGYWAAFHLAAEYKSGQASSMQKNAVLEISHQQLDTTIEKSGHVDGKATTTFVARVDGLRVAPFNLYRTLRVRSVTSESGQQLSFIQEDKNDDFQFFVILPKAVAAGEKISITTVYDGKDAVSNEGGGNYFPIARENWYPSNPGAPFGAYTDYDMTFRIPKGMRMAATGVLIKEDNEGGQNVSVWKSEGPQEVAGFSFGRFKIEEAKLSKPEYEVQSFANQDAPNWVQNLKNVTSNEGSPAERFSPHYEVALGSMETTQLNKKALAEGELAVQLYSDYFGPSLFKHLEVTQQTACNFGQSWPGLVWIPICYYFDTTVRHQLNLDFRDLGYWKVVTPHEVAHQWWGHTVGFSSYRDQWMSEGFADMSASLYLSMIEKNPKKFITFWNDERELLLDRDAQGFRAIDAGPLTMGYRAGNSRTGFATTRSLIYPKGAYVLHMLRMMMYDNRTHDQLFKEMMQDFVNTYRGKSATTEDFKAIVEKHMTQEMDMEGNHKMDWFFNEYVYGTQLPSYQMGATFDTGADGDVVMSAKLTQSNVNDSFRMLVPIYLELPNGIFFLGRARLKGNMTFDQKILLKGTKDKPKRALINYYDDVLASPN